MESLVNPNSFPKALIRSEDMIREKMGQSERELVEQLLDVGSKLASPPANPQDLLSLLNQTESFLSKVKQSPFQSVLTALRPTMKAMVSEKLLNQSDVDLKIAIASCLTQITRITAPDPPYENDVMKVVFHLIVDAFDKLHEISSPSYPKRIKILETVAGTCSCVMLLDLDCEALVLEIFQRFLVTIRPSHPEKVFSSMEAIMTLLLEESEHISSELLSCLLSGVKEDCKDVSPLARQLVEKVIGNCGVKLEPFLSKLIQSTGTALSDYGSVVVSLCQENCNSKIYTTKIEEKELNQKLVGSTIEVWWPDDEKFYPGVVCEYYPDTEKHMISYDDGEIEILILKDECWQYVNSSKVDQVQANDIMRPNVSLKRSDKVANHKSSSVSGSSKVIRKATMTAMKTSEGSDGTANFLPQKRLFTESETETKKSNPKTTEAANKPLKKAKALEGNSVLVAKESSATERKSRGTMSTYSSRSALQDLSSSPAPIKPGKLGDSGKKVLNSFVNVSNITRTAAMPTVDKKPTEVASAKNILVNDDEIEDLRAIEAKKRLQREKRRSQAPGMADGVTSPLTPKASTLDDVNVGLPKHIFDSAFMEKIRVFYEINQNKWYQTNLEPLPNYTELADEFGQDAAFDHGNLFKTIRQMPHYRGLDTSDTRLLEDLWYKLPLVFEALHKSFKSQRYLVRNVETMRGWLTKLAQAGFDVSVPYAAFDLLIVSPTDFANFQKSLDSVTCQLSEEQRNVESLKSKLPVSERVAELDSKIEDLKQQLRDLESERMSLEPFKSVELEFEKYGTSLKFRRLQKLKELYEKEIMEAEQFLRDVSLDGWYQCAEL